MMRLLDHTDVETTEIYLQSMGLEMVQEIRYVFRLKVFAAGFL